MIKAIMAVDDNGGISKGLSMPWPKNSKDLQWFKKNTLNQVIVMGSKTWEDPFMITPLKDRANILITTKLINFSIYVTLEPCQMCESAIINVGIKKIYFGAFSDNLKSHNCKLKNYFSSEKKYEMLGGFREHDCSQLIIDAFKKKR